jgi:hypothetical protein
MAQTSRGVFAAIAISLTLGAAQLASGRDLSASLQGLGGQGLVGQGLGGAPETTINRVAKADRAADEVRSVVPTRTISFQPNALAATSVLVRIPVAQATRNRPSAPVWMRSGDRKATACEPVVSVLTEVAKRLQPGRCVT